MTDFVPTFWNTLTQHNAGSRTSRISGGQVAYKKRGSDWLVVNNAVSSDMAATEFPGNVQFPANAQGWVDIHLNGEYSAKRQTLEGDWHNSEDEFVMRLRAECPANSTGIIHPDKPWQVIYYNAFGQGANLIYGIWKGKTARFEHVIEITETPSGDSEYLTYDFYLQSNDATTFVGPNHDTRPWTGNAGDGATVNGFDVFLAKGSDPATIRGSVLRTPVCWWTDTNGELVRKNVRVDFEIQPDGITVKATKYVKRSDVAEALAQGSVYRADVTFTPDASPETSSVDGYVLRSVISDTWSQLRDGAGTFVNDAAQNANCLRLRADNDTNKWDIMGRGFYFFDTSSIGAGQQVDSGTFRATHEGTRSFSSFQLTAGICGSNSTSTTALSASDFETAQFTSFSSDGVLQSLATTFTEYDFDLNAAGIAAVDVESLTRICFLDKTYDMADSPPVWMMGHEANFGWYFAEHSTRGPELEITHSAASTGSPHNYYQNIQRAS